MDRASLGADRDVESQSIACRGSARASRFTSPRNVFGNGGAAEIFSRHKVFHRVVGRARGDGWR